ncbi:MAG: bifunctional fucokinase/L-fucose-1-P-guanylyltransferase [Lachnospiraceae bacterium]|nr:bifunctional fucokinase/L-fucose-1-P-guanylyltransferase [Lachnospiraceae bacterium]
MYNERKTSGTQNLFLRQSYLDSLEDYSRLLSESGFIRWDYVILTASNEAQAETYRKQIDSRLSSGLLPKGTHYSVLPDPEGKRVGSGGATLAVLKYVAEQENREDPFAGKRIMVIHSGGDSKRVPQYSATGKLFSPVPRELPGGRPSTLFDEFMIGMSGVPSRIREGMLVLSGDVLLLFNPLQIDAIYNGAAAISFKEAAVIGKDHGVFLNDGNGNVARFLHKMPVEALDDAGAVNTQGNVDLDTGAVLFDTRLMNALYGLISDPADFSEFVNEESRLSFYGDFLYPLASCSTLENYLKEPGEGSINDRLIACRKKIWEATRGFNMKLLSLYPSKFIHFGTTGELRELMTKDVEDYKFLNWSKKVITYGPDSPDYSGYMALIEDEVTLGRGVFIENSHISGNSVIGDGAVVSHAMLDNCRINPDTVWHGLILKDGGIVIRVYGVGVNPKENGFWERPLYPVASSWKEAVENAALTQSVLSGKAEAGDVSRWEQMEKLSLRESFERAGSEDQDEFVGKLDARIAARRFEQKLAQGEYYKNAFEVLGSTGISEEVFSILMDDQNPIDDFLRMRVYYAVSRYMKEKGLSILGTTCDEIENRCFKLISDNIYKTAVSTIPDNDKLRIVNENVRVSLPVRVNWGGGWTDTPPQCNEQGGTVLNCAISLNGIMPVQVEVRRIPEYRVEFESADVGVRGKAENVRDILDCHNPFDPFALHKAALIASGIVSLNGQNEDLGTILKRMGGGIYLSTQVVGIPKGSGLGTSSILSAACIRGLDEFMGLASGDAKVYDTVLNMEQIMSTGGGWQDQVGGLTPGIKFIRSGAGWRQRLSVEEVRVPKAAARELKERFVLIYTGQRRLARNLLRDVVGGYIGNRRESLDALHGMERLSVLMRYELERGNIDMFAQLLNEHWELSKQLDQGSSNTCIDLIFRAIEDMIDGRFIAGAGGGGFLQAVLKKGVTPEALDSRIHEAFQDSGVRVWDSELLL